MSREWILLLLSAVLATSNGCTRSQRGEEPAGSTPIPATTVQGKVVIPGDTSTSVNGPTAKGQWSNGTPNLPGSNQSPRNATDLGNGRMQEANNPTPTPSPSPTPSPTPTATPTPTPDPEEVKRVQEMIGEWDGKADLKNDTYRFSDRGLHFKNGSRAEPNTSTGPTPTPSPTPTPTAATTGGG